MGITSTSIDWALRDAVAFAKKLGSGHPRYGYPAWVEGTLEFPVLVYVVEGVEKKLPLERALKHTKPTTAFSKYFRALGKELQESGKFGEILTRDEVAVAIGWEERSHIKLIRELKRVFEGKEGLFTAERQKRVDGKLKRGYWFNKEKKEEVLQVLYNA